MINREAKEIRLELYPELSLTDTRKKYFEVRILITEDKNPPTTSRKAVT